MSAVLLFACDRTEGEPNPPVSPAPGPRPAFDGSSDGRISPVTRSRSLMGTVFRVQLDGAPKDAETTVEQALDEIARLETALSEWREDSDISRINASAGKSKVEVGSDAFRVIDAGIDVSKWSRGAFDLSWAALWGLYDFNAESPKLPEQAQIDERLPLIDYRNIALNPKRKTVRLGKRGMAIGTGGIAKGYALDQAGAILRGSGVPNYMIFGGGQVQVYGRREGRPWRVGIQHPRDPTTYFAALEATNASFSTSGDYEHAFFDQDGKRWHHILDPKTGLPSEKSMSVTVMTSEGIYADALSTAAFVLGPQKALRMFSRIALPAEAVIVGADCRVYMTPKLARQIKFRVELVDDKLPDCEGR